MATFNGIKIVGAAFTESVAAGYTLIPVTAVTSSYMSRESTTVNILHSAITDADPAILFGNLIAELNSLMTTQLDHFDDSGFTVTAHAELDSIKIITAWGDDQSSQSYDCRYKLFIEIA